MLACLNLHGICMSSKLKLAALWMTSNVHVYWFWLKINCNDRWISNNTEVLNIEDRLYNSFWKAFLPHRVNWFIIPKSFQTFTHLWTSLTPRHAPIWNEYYWERLDCLSSANGVNIYSWSQVLGAWFGENIHHWLPKKEHCMGKDIQILNMWEDLYQTLLMMVKLGIKSYIENNFSLV